MGVAPASAGKELDYQMFYAEWRLSQAAVMQELREALMEDNMKEEYEVQGVVEKAEKLYGSYYDAIDKMAQQDVLQVFTPPWKSPLERAFLWLGEWRPSASIQLVYALAGQKVEEELRLLLEGIETPSLASLSAEQLSRISDMQIYVVKDEERLKNEVALLQQSIVDQPLLGLAVQAAVEQNRLVQTCSHSDKARVEELEHDNMPSNVQMHVHTITAAPDVNADTAEYEAHHNVNLYNESLHSAMRNKLKRLEELSHNADGLRRQTLRGVLEVLNTVQRAQFLLALSQLQVAIRNLGERMKGASQTSMEA